MLLVSIHDNFAEELGMRVCSRSDGFLFCTRVLVNRQDWYRTKMVQAHVQEAFVHGAFSLLQRSRRLAKHRLESDKPLRGGVQSSILLHRRDASKGRVEATRGSAEEHGLLKADYRVIGSYELAAGRRYLVGVIEERAA